jgi:hypothetical protein
MTFRKTSVKKKVIHFSIPSLGSLLKVEEKFLKATDKVVVVDVSASGKHSPRLVMLI